MRRSQEKVTCRKRSVTAQGPARSRMVTMERKVSSHGRARTGEVCFDLEENR